MSMLTHDGQRFVAREGMILLGCLLLAAAAWSWGALTTTDAPRPQSRARAVTSATALFSFYLTGAPGGKQQRLHPAVLWPGSVKPAL
jgi:hypothetical protein